MGKSCSMWHLPIRLKGGPMFSWIQIAALKSRHEYSNAAKLTTLGNAHWRWHANTIFGSISNDLWGWSTGHFIITTEINVNILKLFFQLFQKINLPYFGRWARSFSRVQWWWSCWALSSAWHPDWWHHAAIRVCHWWAGDHGIWGRGHWAPACTSNPIVFIYKM